MSGDIESRTITGSMDMGVYVVDLIHHRIEICLGQKLCRCTNDHDQTTVCIFFFRTFCLNCFFHGFQLFALKPGVYGFMTHNAENTVIGDVIFKFS